jgi:hypothetical protein
VFRHACKLGLEGIMSKRLAAPYLSGPSRDWVKSRTGQLGGGAPSGGTMVNDRRFPPPWSADKIPGGVTPTAKRSRTSILVTTKTKHGRRRFPRKTRHAASPSTWCDCRSCWEGEIGVEPRQRCDTLTVRNKCIVFHVSHLMSGTGAPGSSSVEGRWLRSQRPFALGTPEWPMRAARRP